MVRTIGGMRVGQFTPEQVLRDHGIDTRTDVETLVEASRKFDSQNVGYLSVNELSRGAEELRQRLSGAPTTTEAEDVRYSRRVLQEVKDAFLRGRPDHRYSDADLLAAAKRWNDGNAYLNRKELEAGAIELQMGQDGLLSAGDIAAIRMWSGLERAGDPEGDIEGDTRLTQEVDLSEMNRTEAVGFLRETFPGVDFEALVSDAEEVVDNREGSLLGPLRFTTVEPVDDEEQTSRLTLCGEFDYEGAEFSFYAVYDLVGNDYALYDSGAD